MNSFTVRARTHIYTHTFLFSSINVIPKTPRRLVRLYSNEIFCWFSFSNRNFKGLKKYSLGVCVCFFFCWICRERERKQQNISLSFFGSLFVPISIELRRRALVSALFLVSCVRRMWAVRECVNCRPVRLGTTIIPPTIEIKTTTGELGSSFLYIFWAFLGIVELVFFLFFCRREVRQRRRREKWIKNRMDWTWQTDGYSVLFQFENGGGVRAHTRSLVRSLPCPRSFTNQLFSLSLSLCTGAVCANRTAKVRSKKNGGRKRDRKREVVGGIQTRRRRLTVKSNNQSLSIWAGRFFFFQFGIEKEWTNDWSCFYCYCCVNV